MVHRIRHDPARLASWLQQHDVHVRHAVYDDLVPGDVVLHFDTRADTDRAVALLAGRADISRQIPTCRPPWQVFVTGVACAPTAATVFI